MFTELWPGSKNESKEQLLMDYKEVFGTEAGKRVLHDIERLTTFGRSSVSPGKPIDVNKLIYDEGQRSMFLYIVKKINSTPKEERKVDNG